MNLRAFLSVLVAAVTVWLVAGFASSEHNRELLQQPLIFRASAEPAAPFSLSVGESLFAAFVAGGFVVGLAWAVRGMRATVFRARGRREERGRMVLESGYQHGLEAALRGESAVALEHFRGVIETGREHVGALTGAADALSLLGQHGEALDLRERALAVEPHDPRIRLDLAEDHRRRGDLQQASAALLRLLDSRPKDTELARTAAARLRELSLETGDATRAGEAHARWVKLGRGAAAAEGIDGEAPQSAEWVKAAIDTRRAAQEAREGKPTEAVSQLRKLVKKYPDLSPAWLALGQALILDGQESRALEIWVEGYERTREGSLLVAAEEYFRRKDDDGDDMERVSLALSTFQSFVACSGDRPQAVAFLGKLQTRLEMLEAAAASFDSVRESFPDNPTFTYYAARIAEKRGHAEKAAGWYRGILKSLDILSLRFRCKDCQEQVQEYGDRCPSCSRWGTVSLDIGLRPLREPLPAAHPVYEVRAAAADDHEDRGDRGEGERQAKDVLG